MKDPIERQDVIDLLSGVYHYMGSWLVQYIEDGISLISSVQPERKTGKWEQIEVNYFADMDDEIKESMAIASMFCPKCKRYHNEVYLYGNPTYGVNFCPACGADMRGIEV